MAEEKHHHHLFHHHKDGEKISDLEFTTTFEAAGTEVDYKKEEKHHKHVEQLGNVGAAAAGAIALVIYINLKNYFFIILYINLIIVLW
jgi:hypothetical protein